MKIKYLHSEDKRALHELRHTSDLSKIAEILEMVLQRPCTIHALWEYRKWFFMITEEEVKKRPILAIGCSQILVMSGNLKKAKELLNIVSPDSYSYLFSKLVLPGLDKQERMDIFTRIEEKGYAPIPNLTLTAGRPSVLNGVWDFTPYVERLWQNKADTTKQIARLFGEQAAVIYEVALAEALYYQDNCYEALVKVVGLIPFLKKKQDMQLLFVVLTLEVYVMVQNGQTPSTVPMMDNLRRQIKEAGVEEYLPNIDALDAWAAMYDGDYIRIARWMREGAPDEYGRFCILDLFRYMVKMRAYIIQAKYLCVTALATRLLPLLEVGKRYMDLCELHMLWAMSDYAAGRRTEAFLHIKTALELSESYHYDRLLADEGKRMLDLLKAYRSPENINPYLDRLIGLAEASAALFPRYLKNQLPQKPALTETEMRILRLLQDNYTNAQIAQELGIALETAKKHCKNILAKLEVKNRYQAIQRACEFGMIEEPKRGKVPIIEEKRKRN